VHQIRALRSGRCVCRRGWAHRLHGRISCGPGVHSPRTGKSPKTHSGLRSEFARLAHREPRITREQVSLLGWSYELKNAADYEQEHRVSLAEAERAIREALQLIENIAAIIGSTSS
jgi:hypothetical protein